MVKFNSYYFFNAKFAGKEKNVSFLLALSMKDPLFTANIFSGFFCLSLVVYMRFALNNRNNYRLRFFFKRFLEIAVIALLADTLSYGFDRHAFAGARELNYIATSLSIIFTTFVGFIWNRFFDIVLHVKAKKTLRTVIFATPVVVSFALAIANLYNGRFFVIGEDNVYTRGEYAFVSFIVQYFGYAAVAVRAIFHRFKVRTLRYVKLRNSFIWAGCAMLLFGAFQIIGGGSVALQCCGITAGMFVMYLRFQDDQITNDILTGLNNRYALDTYLEDKMRVYHNGTHSGKRLYLILMDINSFKEINDEHGHIEGDRALKTVATTLKAVGMRYRSSLFIARYGGDEFAAVLESHSEKRPVKLCVDIKEMLREESEGLDYELTMGTGYATYTGAAMNYAAFYNLADKALYEDKDRMKNPVELTIEPIESSEVE